MSFEYKLSQDNTKIFFDTVENCHKPERNAVATGRSKNHTLARDLYFSQAVFVLRSTISSMDCSGHRKIRKGLVGGKRITGEGLSFSKSQEVSNVRALQIFERKVCLSIQTLENFRTRPSFVR